MSCGMERAGDIPGLVPVSCGSGSSPASVRDGACPHCDLGDQSHRGTRLVGAWGHGGAAALCVLCVRWMPVCAHVWGCAGMHRAAAGTVQWALGWWSPLLLPSPLLKLPPLGRTMVNAAFTEIREAAFAHIPSLQFLYVSALASRCVPMFPSCQPWPDAFPFSLQPAQLQQVHTDRGQRLRRPLTPPVPVCGWGDRKSVV